ncbi:STAS domain-containing protein [Actinoplanes subglobosus]|uniref:STAS domain-containing protein n=1 Tax=Actinoplanes subglobosus TaxID=1547892 RepID=A0ABV8J5J1_9ACTN
MSGAAVDVATGPDGTMIIQPHGVLDAGDAVDMQRTIAHAVRHTRPLRLVVDLHDLQDLDAINLGTLAAACELGDDHQVAVFLDHPSAVIADRNTSPAFPAIACAATHTPPDRHRSRPPPFSRPGTRW